MSYDEPESGKKAIVKYDQTPRDSDDERVVHARGEVMGILDELVDVDDNGRTLKLDLENESVTIIRRRTPEGQEDDKVVYDLVDFEMESLDNHLIREDELYDNAEKYTDELDDVTGAIARANAALGIVHRESDAEFVSQYDAWHAADVYENGLQQRLDAHNEQDYSEGDDRVTIRFPNESLAYIWVEEICGQISDGAWENKVSNWQQYYGAYVEVDESLRNVEVDGYLPSLDFSTELMKYDGLPGRMMFYLIASGVNEDVDLGELQEMVSMRLQNGIADSSRVSA
ncbi:hypothetical protein HCTV-16_gp141 [Haloarcula virus HCTV-16]|nr:hypothetical protein HCTV-16_gp141 [Haloarcula virus HCTV-16]